VVVAIAAAAAVVATAVAVAASAAVAVAADIAKKQHPWQAEPFRKDLSLSRRVKIIWPFRRSPWPVYDQRRSANSRQLKS
jgi:hypothetical protein